MTNGNELVTASGDYTADCGHGLTKRELFAAMAMQGLLSDTCEIKCASFAEVTRHLSIAAVGYADALIAELNKDVPPTEGPITAGGL